MVSVPKHMYPESSVYQSGPMGAGQGLATPLRMGGRTDFVHLRDLQERTAPVSPYAQTQAPAYAPVAGQSILGKRSLEADASLTLVGDLLQNQSRRMIQLLEEQRGARATLEAARSSLLWNQQRLRQLTEQTAEQEERVRASDSGLVSVHERLASIFTERDRAFESCRALTKDSRALRAALPKAAPAVHAVLPPAPSEPDGPQASLPPLVLLPWPPAIFAQGPAFARASSEDHSPVKGMYSCAAAAVVAARMVRPPPQPTAPAAAACAIEALALLSDVAGRSSDYRGSTSIEV